MIITKFKIYENTDNKYSENLKILKEYVDILEKSYILNKIILKYAIILHNFIILENHYLDIVEESGYEINKYLDITGNVSSYWANKILITLYDPEHRVRNNVESFDRLKVISEFLENNPEMYNRLFTENEIDMLIQTNNYNI